MEERITERKRRNVHLPENVWMYLCVSTCCQHPITTRALNLLPNNEPVVLAIKKIHSGGEQNSCRSCWTVGLSLISFGKNADFQFNLLISFLKPHNNHLFTRRYWFQRYTHFKYHKFELCCILLEKNPQKV